ncbi:DUF481 domain-containing protein [Lignipirellula cremea]|uniref:DUF481 domain-containing protein n=1 Tax=Lignipirellula cremea TaxID=2528010 RepID=A0A518DY47_9BACT|nr:DUF481 domain-containing protein [Lignipirellula cremea]QDU96768.1 hypothetical protein Pla8534_45890 [Lignipirellula cremea]
MKHSRKILLGAIALLWLAAGVQAQEMPMGNDEIYLLPPLEMLEPPPPEPDAEPEPKPSSAEPAAETIAVEEIGPAPPTYWFYQIWDPWEGSFQLGLDGTEGNTQTFNLQTGFKAKYDDATQTDTFEITHVDKSRDGVQTALNTLIDGRMEWKMPKSPFTVYGHTFIEIDAFKDFDERVSADAGLGYRFLELPDHKLTARLGLSASREIGGPNNAVTPEMIAGAEWSYKPNKRQKFSAKVDYFPAIENFSDFRMNTRAEWETVLSQEWGLSMKLSMIDRYDSTPGTSKPNDINYAALMMLGF